MPVSPRVQDQAVTRLRRVAPFLLCSAIVAGGLVDLVARAQNGAAYFVRSLENSRADRREARPDILDTPILPGSVIKAVTLVAALESQVIEPDTARICRRTVTIAGRRYVCSHPDLKRPLTPAEALAHSCNDFFVSLVPRLSRSAFNHVRTGLGLPPVADRANLAASLVGLDGPRISPRALLDAIASLAGADPQRPIAMSAATRAVLLEGMRGAATYGSAQAFSEVGVSALAKTGTAPMPGGSWMGLVVALSPADKPRRAVVVVAPGAAGLDAAAIAADLLATTVGVGAEPARPARAPAGALDPPRPSAAGSLPAPVPPALSAASAPTLRIGVTSANGTVRVTELEIDAYIARVVAGEGQPRAGDGAQQALAITARTFALANRNRHRREHYDLCDSTHCQVMRPATETSRRAAEATSGRVLMHQGQPASVFYSASCGGRTEVASEVWPGALSYSESSRTDDACADEPEWTSEVSVAHLERALRAAGLRGDRLRDLRVIRRNASGRAALIRAEGFTPNEISGADFRTVVGRVAGWQRMKSTAFEIRRVGGGYQFTGSGFGHGVGLCVIGAGGRAARGESADDILKFYFPKLRVSNFVGATRLTATPPKPALPAAPPSPDPQRAETPRADVLLALPGGEEGERARLGALIRTARDQIAAMTGAAVPSSIRVTVHPTVESFGRATGQPWWVSGATDGSNIDVLPLSILRQQGQIERTIRHEIAHVVIDGALNKRPLWVREGAAFYFAAPAPSADTPARTSCPKDDEFLRPLSVGTHRDAYARAEACFRRALADGKRWQEVR